MFKCVTHYNNSAASHHAASISLSPMDLAPIRHRPHIDSEQALGAILAGRHIRMELRGMPRPLY